MSKRVKIIIGLCLIGLAPCMIELGYMERGYYAIGGEYLAMFMLIVVGTWLLTSNRKRRRKGRW